MTLTFALVFILMIGAALAAMVLASRASARRSLHRTTTPLPRSGIYILALAGAAIPLIIFGIVSFYGLAFFVVITPVLALRISHELRAHR